MLKTKMQAINTSKKVDFILNYSTLTQPNLTQANIVLSKMNFFSCVYRLHFHFQHIKKPLKTHPCKKIKLAKGVNLNVYPDFNFLLFQWICACSEVSQNIYNALLSPVIL